MPRWVLLRHSLPDGSSHHDWMLERSEQAGLVTFRLADGVNPLARSPERFEATRLGQHRSEYLEYEGPVSGGRGVVARVDSGLAEIVDSPPDGMSISLYHKDLQSIVTWNGRLLPAATPSGEGERWLFELAD